MLSPLFHPANTAPLDFAEDDLSRIAELLDTALAVAHADPNTAPVWVAVPRTELRSCPTKALTKPARTPPRCPSCAQPMRLVRKTLRFHGLPELYTFECRTCDVSFTQEGDAVVS